jgi:ABC-type uncharacterized transport system substrate-binding protein
LIAKRQFWPLCGAFAFLAATPAAAHPHVWASVRSEIILDANKQVTGVRQAWTFDEMYSAMAVQGLDTSGDGTYSEAELKPLTDVNINSLKEFDYFTFVHVGEADALPLKPPENASLDVYDPSFFVAFGFANESPVTLSGPAVKGCTAEVKKPDPEAEEDAKALSEAFFSQLGPNSNFGSQFAQTVTVKCSDAPS